MSEYAKEIGSGDIIYDLTFHRNCSNADLCEYFSEYPEEDYDEEYEQIYSYQEMVNKILEMIEWIERGDYYNDIIENDFDYDHIVNEARKALRGCKTTRMVKSAKF